MPLSRRVARFNRAVTNRGLGRVAPWLSGFGVVHHLGRRSGRTYRTPVNLFRSGRTYTVALTYGSGADWVQNVLAAGTCDLETRRTLHHLVEPGLSVGAGAVAMPLLVRAILRIVAVDEFLHLDLAENDLGARPRSQR